MLAFLVHFLSLFALALWVGGGAAISFVVAPVVFEKAGSRSLAGELLGQVLRRFDTFALVAGPFALAAAWLELSGVPTAARTLGLKAALIAAMLGLAAYSRLALAPEVRKAREAEGDPARARASVGRLHALWGLCVLGEILLGAFALALSVMPLSARVG